MQISARFTGAIASAVAGEVTRLDLHPEFHRSEGSAYKGAWSRLGSDPLKHCEAARRDCLVASLVAALPHRAARDLAIRDGLGIERRGSLGRFNPERRA